MYNTINAHIVAKILNHILLSLAYFYGLIYKLIDASNSSESENQFHRMLKAGKLIC